MPIWRLDHGDASIPPMKNIRLRSYKDIGTILVADGSLTLERLRDAQEIQRASMVPLGRTLVELGFINEWDLARAISKELSLPFVRLKLAAPSGDAINKLDAGTMHHQRMFCLESFDGVDTLIITEPPTIEVMSDISPLLADKVFLVVALLSDVEAVLNVAVPKPNATEPNGAEVSAEDILNGFGT